jgi:autotransporter-associated beta strand protein
VVTISSAVGSAVTDIIQNSATNALIISGAISANSNGLNIINNSTALLTVSGDISGTSNLFLKNNSTTSNGITLSGSSINNNGSIVNEGTGSGSVLISSIISSASGVTQNSSSSSLTLSGANTYTGLTTVSAGSLIYGANDVISDTGAININGGTLDLGAFNDTVGMVVLNSGNITSTTGILSSAAFAMQSGSVDAILGGSGTLNKTTSGSVTFTKANNYTGLTTISEGSFIYGADNVISTGDVTVDGGTLDLGMFNDTVGTVTLSSGNINGTTGTLTSTGTFEMQSGSVSAILAGFGNALNKTTAGTVILSGNNNYTGTTTINDGTLQIGNGSTTGTLGTGNVVNNSALVFNRSDDYSVSNAISGLGTVTQAGAGALTLSGANSYQGTTTISSGTLLNISTNSTALGSGTVNVFGTLGLISGTGLTIANNIVLNNGSSLADTGVAVINTLTGNITLAGSGDAIISSNLELDIAGTIDSAIAGISGLNIQGNGAVNLNGVVGGSNALASITSDLATIVGLGASITTTGSQTYNGASTIGIAGSVALTSTGGSITFVRSTELLADTQINADVNISLDNINGHFHTLDLVGSSGNNSFIFNNSVVDTIGFTVNGGSTGTDTLDFSNLADARTIILSSTGSSHGFTGSDASYAGLSFDNINSIAGNSSVSNTLTGNSGSSAWTLSGNDSGNYSSTNLLDFSNIGTLVGGGGINTLIAANVANTWNITGSDTGSVTGLSGSFSAMQNLIGGSTNKNIFNFAAGAAISGSVDGGNTSNINELNFADNVTIHLQSLTTGNVTNTNTTSNIVLFSNIQQARGQGATSNLYIPTGKAYTITYYDTTKTNGEIGDPFYFFNMFVLNVPVPPAPAPTPVVDTMINVYNVIASATQTTDDLTNDTTTEAEEDDVVTTAVNENLDQVIEDTAAKIDMQTESAQTFGCFSTQ